MKLDWKTRELPIVALSPMADMTDSAFCRAVSFVCDDADTNDARANGRLVFFREMVSSEAIVRGNDKTLEMCKIHTDERPIVQQLFGSVPDTMAKAARIIEERFHPDGFDINMGCPVYKIVHQFNGAALMRQPELASQIIKKMKTQITVPLSVKIRTGWDDADECLEFSKIIETAGADMITIHGRTKTQGYAGVSDWEQIAKMKQGVSIPVLANGDAHTPQLALQAIKQTKCDGILIARGALGNPWIFPQIEAMLSGRQPTPVSLEKRVELIKIHLRFHIEQYGERGIVTFRKHLSWYFRGIDGAKPFKERLHTAVSVEQCENILDEIVKHGLNNQALSTRDAHHPFASEKMRMSK